MPGLKLLNDNQKYTQRLKGLGPWHFLIELKPGLYTIPRNQWKTYWHSIIVQDYVSRCVLDYLRIFNRKIKKETKIIDIGCNEGWLAAALYKEGYKNITGIDADSANIKKANFLKEHFQMGEAKFVCADISNFKAKDSFDFSIMLGVINHINNPIAALENIYSFTDDYFFLDFDSFLSDNDDRFDAPEFNRRIFSVDGRMKCHFESKSQVTSAKENNLVFQYSKRAMTLMMTSVGFTDIFHTVQRISTPSHYKKDKRIFLIAKKDKTKLNYYKEFELEASYSKARQDFDLPVPVLIEEFKAHNIVRYGTTFFAIPHGELEAFDINKIIFNKKCLFAETREGIISLVHKISGIRADSKSDDSDTDIYDSFRFEVGKEMILQNRIDDAQFIFNHLMEKYSESGNTIYLNSLYQLGKIEQKIGKNEGAKLIWEKCIDIDHEFKKAALRLLELNFNDDPQYNLFT